MDRSAEEPDLWLRCFVAAPRARTRLVCFPHAGGSASAYHAMAGALPPAAEVLAVQYPGRQDRRAEKCVDNVPELVDRLVPVLTASADDRPLALFGHSMGATLAYEVARRLEREGGANSPVTVFLSGRRAPRFERSEYIHQRDDRGILRELELLGGSGAVALADPEILQMVMPAIRGDYRAAETYVHVPGPPLRCPVVALTGDADPRAAVAEVEAWREYTEGPFTTQVFKGGHFFLNDHPDAVHGTVRDRLSSLPVSGAGTH
ncbi:thioesterase II family protein [Streptomyces scabiei]|uniref:Linear gramicidin dehydrogenase LgrE n=1 Tax=Streptomyces scabiei TaxID=1930 RepID=A0A117EFN1_STRSC|nr:alpha/beta fold hydrolase [Streptomyces scabiei]GAQ65853.1 linear gramicidin dehydrogenase LgrE [Streptomyces scabiei]